MARIFLSYVHRDQQRAWPDFCSDPMLPYNCKKEAAKYRI